MSSLENRIRTLVSVACADRNYLFGLPPMLDGLPQPGQDDRRRGSPEYGESVTGVRAGPWPGCVFRDNIVYVHSSMVADPPPPIPAKLVSSKYLTAENEKPDTILKLEYDRSVEEFALAAPSQGSLTAGKRADRRSDRPRPADGLRPPGVHDRESRLSPRAGHCGSNFKPNRPTVPGGPCIAARFSARSTASGSTP